MVWMQRLLARWYQLALLMLGALFAQSAQAQVANSCNGRPITPITLANPTLISGTALQVGAVYSYANAAPGIDVRVRIDAFAGGASLITIDNNAGLSGNFQPELGGVNARRADFTFSFFVAGTTTPLVFDFTASAVDVDGDSANIREYAEFTTTQQVSYFLDSATRLAVDASGPSAAGRRRFEASTSVNAPGITENETRNIVSASYTNTSSFGYSIGALGTGNTVRLSSLDFACPRTPFVDPVSGGNPPQDFSDAPASYGNPIHDIVTGFRIGAANNAETAPFANATATGDTGDDGFTGATFRRSQTTTLNIPITGAGGRLQCWIDWNGDGDFLDAGEQAATNIADNGTGDTNAAAGTIGLSIAAPANAVLTPTFMRLRWSTTLDAPPSTLNLSNGEVEDYQITILGIPILALAKISAVFNPPGTIPFSIPGNDMLYTISVSNNGSAATDSNSVFFVDSLPGFVTYFNGDVDGAGPATGPVSFTAGSSGLTFNAATDLRYSNAVAAPANFAACSYTPVVGYDPGVRHICFNPKGAMSSGGAPAPQANFQIRTRIN